VDNKNNGKNISLTCPQVACTVALFLPIIGISLATDNVGVVLSFKGSCLSSLVVYIIPGLAYIRLMRPAGFSGLFGPWLLIVYGTGATASPLNTHALLFSLLLCCMPRHLPLTQLFLVLQCTA
jgi:amino acid permease